MLAEQNNVLIIIFLFLTGDKALGEVTYTLGYSDSSLKVNWTNRRYKIGNMKADKRRDQLYAFKIFNCCQNESLCNSLERFIDSSSGRPR